MQIEDVLKRLKIIFNVSYNNELSAVLGVKHSTFATWVQRKKIPYELLFDVSQNEKISMSWLVTGEESSGNTVSGNDNIANNKAGGNISISVSRGEKPDHNKEVNMQEDELLDAFRMMTDKQKQYIYYKMKAFVLENEFHAE